MTLLGDAWNIPIAESATTPPSGPRRNRNDRPPVPGSIVWIRQQRWLVQRISVEGGTAQLEATGPQGPRTFVLPFDHAQMDAPGRRLRVVSRQRALARTAGLLAGRRAWGLPAALLKADVTLLAYQIEPALAMAAGERRVLIADEVGLGKTIQAGLVIAELTRSEPARILVLVPPALADQWAAELGRRFGVLVDRAHATSWLRTSPHAVSDAPWTRSAVWVSSIDYLKQPHVFASLPHDPWDLVVIDEAHQACGDSDRYEACRRLCEASRRVLLLTATPHSGDPARFQRLTRLGAWRGGEDALVVFRRTRAAVRADSARRIVWRRLVAPDDQSRVLDALLSYERAVLQRHAADAEAPLLLLSVLRKRALSTLGAFAASVARRLEVLHERQGGPSPAWRQSMLPFDEDDEVGADERAALAIDSGLDRAAESVWLRRLHRLAVAAPDVKLAHLRRLVSRTREPVVIFTEYRHSLEIIARAVAPYRAVAVMHGGQPPGERTAALHRFCTGAATALVATDVAGQGLNLQQASRWVVSVELPWNPLVLEQRLGRVDRMGQPRRVHATILLQRHPCEDALVARVFTRVQAAQRALGAGALTWAEGLDDRAVARAMIAGGDLPRGVAPAPLDTPTAWTRAARAAVRIVTTRRRFDRHWRGPQIAGARCWQSCHGRPSVARRALAIVSVPILDGDGVELDVVVIPMLGTGLGIDAWRTAAGLERRVAARRQRIARRLSRLVARRAATERGLARVFAARVPHEYTGGLFDHREWREIEGARRDEQERQHDVERRVARWQDAARLSLGPARVDVIIEPWPW